MQPGLGPGLAQPPPTLAPPQRPENTPRRSSFLGQLRRKSNQSVSITNVGPLATSQPPVPITGPPSAEPTFQAPTVKGMAGTRPPTGRDPAQVHQEDMALSEAIARSKKDVNLLQEALARSLEESQSSAAAAEEDERQLRLGMLISREEANLRRHEQELSRRSSQRRREEDHEREELETAIAMSLQQQEQRARARLPDWEEWSDHRRRESEPLASTSQVTLQNQSGSSGRADPHIREARAHSDLQASPSHSPSVNASNLGASNPSATNSARLPALTVTNLASAGEEDEGALDSPPPPPYSESLSATSTPFSQGSTVAATVPSSPRPDFVPVPVEEASEPAPSLLPAGRVSRNRLRLAASMQHLSYSASSNSDYSERPSLPSSSSHESEIGIPSAAGFPAAYSTAPSNFIPKESENSAVVIPASPSPSSSATRPGVRPNIAMRTSRLLAEAHGNTASETLPSIPALAPSTLDVDSSQLRARPSSFAGVGGQELRRPSPTPSRPNSTINLSPANSFRAGALPPAAKPAKAPPLPRNSSGPPTSTVYSNSSNSSVAASVAAALANRPTLRNRSRSGSSPFATVTSSTHVPPPLPKKPAAYQPGSPKATLTPPIPTRPVPPPPKPPELMQRGSSSSQASFKSIPPVRESSSPSIPSVTKEPDSTQEKLSGQPISEEPLDVEEEDDDEEVRDPFDDFYAVQTETLAKPWHKYQNAQGHIQPSPSLSSPSPSPSPSASPTETPSHQSRSNSALSTETETSAFPRSGSSSWLSPSPSASLSEQDLASTTTFMSVANAPISNVDALEDVTFGYSPAFFGNTLSNSGPLPDAIRLSDLVESDLISFCVEAPTFGRLLLFLFQFGNSVIELMPREGMGDPKEFQLTTSLAFWHQNPSSDEAGASSATNSGIAPTRVRVKLDLRFPSEKNRVSPMLPTGTDFGVGRLPKCLEMPRPYHSLPLQIGKLAGSLHALHRLARRHCQDKHATSHGYGLTHNYYPKKMHPNSKVLIDLFAAINVVERENGLEEEEPIRNQTKPHSKLNKVGKKLFKRKSSESDSETSQLPTEAMHLTPFDVPMPQEHENNDN